MENLVSVKPQLITTLSLFRCEGLFLHPPSRNAVEIPKTEFTALRTWLKKYRGSWDGRHQAFKFPFNTEPFVSAILATHKAPKPNPLALHPTPRALCLAAASLADLYQGWGESGYRVLEPNGGTGALLDIIEELRGEGGTLHTCELDPLNQGTLSAKGYHLVGDDFLQYSVSEEEKYDIIIMNPPFSVKGDQAAWVTHIRHAYSLLKPRGRLVAISPEFGGILNTGNNAEREFIEWLSMDGTLYAEQVEAGTFATAKGIKTMLFSLSGPSDRTDYLVCEARAQEQFELIYHNSGDIYGDVYTITEGHTKPMTNPEVDQVVDRVLREAREHQAFLPRCYHFAYCDLLQPAGILSSPEYDDKGQALLFAA